MFQSQMKEEMFFFAMNLASKQSKYGHRKLVLEVGVRQSRPRWCKNSNRVKF